MVVCHQPRCVLRGVLFGALLGAVLTTGCATTEAERNRALRRDMLGQLVHQKAWGQAFPLARQLLEEDPGEAEVLAYRGIIYREQLLYDEAESDLKEALRHDDQLAMAHSALAVLYDIQQRGADAEKHHRRAVEIEPQSVRYLNNLGFSQSVRGKNREAIKTYRKALRVDPTDDRSHNNLGFAHARLGDYNQALKHFQLGSPPAQARNNLGFAYEQQGNHAQAYALYVEALRLDPQLLQARKNLQHVAGILDREIPADLLDPGPRAAGGGI